MHDDEMSAATGERVTDAGEGSIADAPTPDAQAAFLAETDAHSRSTKRGWIIGGAVAVVVAIAAVAWALWPSAEADRSGRAPSQVSAPIVTAEPTDTPGARKKSAAASSTAQSAAGTATIAQPAAPNTVAAAGSKLVELQAPPERTVGMLVVPKGFTAASYNVVFQPYGWGPGGAESGRLLVKVTSSKPANESATKLDKDFAGRNVTLWATPQAAAVITLGGTYQGVMQVRPQGDVGVLYLVNAKSAQ